MDRVKHLASAILDKTSNTLVGLHGKFRKVRVELEGKERLEMREVRVYDENNANKARSAGTTTDQSTIYLDGTGLLLTTYPASKAVDGNDSQTHGSRTYSQQGK
jgi:hypothetical protein